MSPAATRTDPAAQPNSVANNRFPAGVRFIIGSEVAQRFSYFGMRAVLYLYLTSLYLGFANRTTLTSRLLGEAETRATQVTHLFMAGLYALPMVGAILADRLLGKYRAIICFSLLCCAGHATLATAGHVAAGGAVDNAEVGVYAGLALIALGAGGLQPCVSANVGDQFTQENGHLVPDVFQFFYFIVNFGYFFATLIIPVIYRAYGADPAFRITGVAMAIATVVVWLGRNRVAKLPPNPGGRLGLLDFASALFFFLPVAAFLVGRDFLHTRMVDTAFADAVEGGWTATFLVLSFASVLSICLGYALFLRRQSIEPDNGFLAVLLFARRHQYLRRWGSGYFSVAKYQYEGESVEGPPAVLSMMAVFSLVSVFWALFEQHSSTWIKQAEDMNLEVHVSASMGIYAAVATTVLSAYGLLWILLRVSNIAIPKKVNLAVMVVAVGCGVAAWGQHVSSPHWLNYTIQPSQLVALNPLMVLILIPFLNFAVYKPLEARGLPIRPLTRMTIGMFLAALAFVAAALLQTRIEAGDKVHVLWQTIQYGLMTTAEVLVAVTGLEFAYTQAPRRMKSTVMGLWVMCVTFGNLLVAALAPLQQVSLSYFFWVFAGLMAVAATLFAVLASLYRGKTYLQQEAASEVEVP